MSGSGDVAWVVAPAKLTLSLRVLGVRPDGFHELDSEMVALDLVDELFIDPGGDGLGIEVDGAVGSLPDDRANLISRALDALGRSASVRLVKRIPIGGGLGGGSSDAAAVLRWAGSPDLEVASRLGADVPFCVLGGRARVRGLGERVEPLAYESRSFVLLVPPLAVDTAAAYRAWDELPEARRHASAGEGENDLTRAALTVVPALARWRDRFGEITGALPRLAGSGATWFVEGTMEGLGLERGRPIEVGGQAGRVIPVHTVPAGYSGAGSPE
jgi:4-diphosphocytidyl-2-C-methyl-D-erythritol kinase